MSDKIEKRKRRHSRAKDVVRQPEGSRERGAPVRRALPALVRLYLRVAREDVERLGFDMARRRPDPNEAERVVVRVAFHEAAHAVVLRHSVGILPVMVCIEGGSDMLNHPGWGFTRRSVNILHLLSSAEQVRTLLENSPPGTEAVMRRVAECEVMVALAGIAVEEARAPDGEGRALVERIRGQPDDDVGQARTMLLKFERDSDRCWQWLGRLAAETEKLVRRPDIAAAITTLAEALLNKPTLQGDEIFALLASLRPSSAG